MDEFAFLYGSEYLVPPAGVYTWLDELNTDTLREVIANVDELVASHSQSQTPQSEATVTTPVLVPGSSQPPMLAQSQPPGSSAGSIRTPTARTAAPVLVIDSDED